MFNDDTNNGYIPVDNTTESENTTVPVDDITTTQQTEGFSQTPTVNEPIENSSYKSSYEVDDSCFVDDIKVDDIKVDDIKIEEPIKEQAEPVEDRQPTYSAYHILENTPVINETPKKPRKYSFFVKVVAAGLVFGIVAFGTIYGASQFFPIKTVSKTNNIATVTQTTSPISYETESSSFLVSNVVKEVMPAVVSINCSTTTVYNSFFGQQEYEATSAGTGIIVGSNDSELLIATNNHVVNGANAIQITFDDQTTANAVLKGSATDVDLAVVAVMWDDLSAESKEKIKIATLGDSSNITVGEPAIAIGNSLGYGQSVTYGIVSALNREVTVQTDSTYGYGNSQEITSELIQTDAAINPGNSGGPLLNSKGEVIGINSVKYASSDVEGMGYAIPISEALPILEDLMNRQTKVKVDEDKQSYLGITGTNVTSDASEIYGMPIGVFVAQVDEDTAADNAGIKRGDIIVQIGDTPVSTIEDLQEELLYYEENTTVEVIINRSNGGEYEEIKLEVTLGSKKDAPEPEVTEAPNNFNPFFN